MINIRTTITRKKYIEHIYLYFNHSISKFKKMHDHQSVINFIPNLDLLLAGMKFVLLP